MLKSCCSNLKIPSRVTSRVAENLVEMSITSKEALMELTEEELRYVKGIGPKRAAKILELE
jgi:ERCC4-type nuclease